MRPVLVKISVACATLSLGVDAINELATAGDLLWVWNLATNPNGKIASLRFFLSELEARAEGDTRRFASFGLAQILDKVLPPGRAFWPAGALDQLFQLSRPGRIALNGEIMVRNRVISQGGASNTYRREDLAEFLRRRWLGNLEASPRVQAGKSDQAQAGFHLREGFVNNAGTDTRRI